MPATLQWYVRTAMLYIAAAMVLGVLYQVDQVTRWFGSSRYLITIHLHLALVGGVIQIIMGIGLWMLPLTVPIDRRLQYKERLAWLTYGLFNAGLLGRFVAESRFQATGDAAWGWVTVATGVMQFVAFGIFLYHAWSLRLSRRAQLGPERSP
ncbi:MAG TPA: hypothetical protein VF678_00645 [bacterium]